MLSATLAGVLVAFMFQLGMTALLPPAGTAGGVEPRPPDAAER